MPSYVGLVNWTEQGTKEFRVAAAGNVHTSTMRAFDADQMSDIIARTG